MKNKPKTNKWVDPTRPATIMEQIEQLEVRFLALSLDHPRQEWKAFNHYLAKLINQTQQDTLEWCLKEVEKNKNHIMIENFDVSKKYSKGWNNCVEHISQAIKQRIKSLKENNGKH